MAEYLIQEETLTEMADAVRSKSVFLKEALALVTASGNFTIDSLPEGLTKIREYAFRERADLSITFIPEGVRVINVGSFLSCKSIRILLFPASIRDINQSAFQNCTGLTSVTFIGKPSIIASSVFKNCTNLTTINVPWSEGEVANAPWGATKATINYNYTAE